ncbi:MAG: hypothetical protein RMJ83_10590 [Armatimonadota bacterium]|nr:hypothetical protein [Armatimonadota bacterium]
MPTTKLREVSDYGEQHPVTKPIQSRPPQVRIHECRDQKSYETPKGAIRTALLEAVLGELKEDDARRYAREIAQRTERGAPEYDRRYVARRVLEKNLLTGDKSPRKEDPKADLDPNYDLLRVLHVAGSEPIAAEQVEVGVAWVYTLRNEALVQKRAGGEEYKTLVEWLPTGVATQVEIALDEHLLSERMRQQPGFSNEGVEHIRAFVKACNERASSLIESEGAFYEEYNLAVARQFYRQLNTRLQQVERAGGFLLNIGWGGGWEDENRAQPAHRGLRRRVRADPTALPVGAPAQGVS